MPFQPRRIRLLLTICANGATDLLAGRVYETCQPPSGAGGGNWVWSESIKEAIFLTINEFHFIN
jgi:hypothetical protein